MRHHVTRTERLMISAARLMRSLTGRCPECRMKGAHKLSCSRRAGEKGIRLTLSLKPCAYCFKLAENTCTACGRNICVNHTRMADWETCCAPWCMDISPPTPFPGDQP